MENQLQDDAHKSSSTQDTSAPKATVTHNLDTGKDEPLTSLSDDDETLMDFGSGSGGGSAGDGGAA